MKLAVSSAIAAAAFLSVFLVAPSYGQRARIDNLHAVLASAKPDTNKVRTLLDASDLYKNRDPKKARDHAEQALALSSRLKARRLTARAHVKLGYALIDLQSRTAAGDHFRAALTQAEQTNDREVVGDAYNGLGVVLSHSGKAEDALPSFQKALSVFERAGLKNGMANTLSNIASRVHQPGGKYAEAMDAYLRSRRLYEETNDKAGVAGIRINIGVMHMRQGRYAAAVEHLREGLAVSEEIGHLKWKKNALQNLSVTYSRLGRVDSALGFQNRAYSLSEELGDKAGMAQSLIAKASIFSRQEKPQKALDAYDSAIRLAKEIGDANLHAMALANGATIHARLGRYDSSRKQSEEAVHLYESIGDSIAMQTPLNTIAVLHQQQGRYAEALPFLRRNLRIVEALGHRREIALYSSTMGQVHRSLGRIDSALIFSNRSMAIYKELQNKEGIANTANLIALIHKDRGNTTDAIDMFELSMRLMEETGNKNGSAYAMHNLAGLLLSIGRHGTARDMSGKAHAILASIGDARGMAATLLGIADASAQLGLKDTAMAYYQRCVKLYDTLGDKVNAAKALNNMARLYDHPSQHREAYDILRRSLTLYEELGVKSEIASTLVLIAALELELGDVDTAREHAARGLNIARELGHMARMQDAYLALSRVSVARQDFVKAYEYQSEYSLIRDTLLAEKNIASINELQAKYESEKKARQIVVLEKDRALHTAALERQGKELLLGRLEADRNRQLARVLAGEHDRRLLELNYRTTQLELHAQRLRREQAEKKHLQKQREDQAVIVSRETGLRNALLAGLALFFITGFLGVKHLRANRTEAILRAEAAEYQARALEAESERREKEYQKEFARSLIESQEQERKRIAVELHDGLGQNLMIIKNQLYYLTQYETLTGDTIQRMEQISEVAATAIEDVRQLSYNLRPILIERTGLTRTLTDTLEKVASSSGLRIVTEIENCDAVFTMTEQINLYRIVQEALNNILKYAEATRVDVRLAMTDAGVQLVVRDDGRGFDPDADRSTHGLGIQSIRERSDILGGSMQLRSMKGLGTTIEVSIPLMRPELVRA